MMDDDDDSTALVAKGKQCNLRPDFPQIRAYVVSGLALLLYIFSSFVVVPVISQYVVERLWQEKFNSSYSNRTHNKSNEHCPMGNESGSGDPELGIQMEASNITLYYTLVANGIALFVNIYAGPLTDSLGRKIAYFIPVCGVLAKNTLVTFIVYYDWNLNLFYLAYAFDGISGSYFAIAMAVFSYTADITIPGKTRTFAITLVEGGVALSVATGLLGNGYFIKYTGFLYPMITFVCIGLLNLTIISFLLPETLTVKTKPEMSPVKNLKKVFGFYFTMGTTRKRVAYLLALCMFFFSTVPGLGRSALETIYQLGEPFCWSSVKIGYFGCIRYVVTFTFALVGLKVLRRCLREEIVGVTGSLSSVAGYLLEGFANTDILMYLVPAVSLLSGINTPLSRAMISKMTLPSQQGAVFASIAVVEVLCGSTSTLIYNAMYSATVQYYRGIVWFIMAGVAFLDTISFLLFMYVSDKCEDMYPSYQVQVTSKSINDDSETAVTTVESR